MNALQIPMLLKDEWQQALIMTYGLNALFFENALSSMLGATCRNRIILADGREYLEACTGYAENNLVRYLNQRYVAEGIFSPHAAHAKLILLTHPERGRLLVGSGNMNLQGYASGGELFCHYEWTPDARSTLPAFQTVIDLCRTLARSGLISHTAHDHIEHLIEQTPWLETYDSAGRSPVRHNLVEPFLSQFSEVVGAEPVEQLIVMVPFYDQKAFALQKMLEQLSPHHVKIIVQPGRTSVDPEALNSVLSAFPGSVELLTVADPDGDNTYFHTKLYLAKTASRAICLQGSPNLSQRAMLWTLKNGKGNIEVANLLTGGREQFDDIFATLSLTPVQLDDPELKLEYQSGASGENPDILHLPFRLLSGSLQDARLVLRFDGDLPDLELLTLSDDPFPVEILEETQQTLALQLGETAVSRLGHTIPLRLQWIDDGQTHLSNPIYICNRASLNAELQTPIKGGKPERFGTLDLEDEELELLIGELESHMVLDSRSFWQLVSRQPSTEEDNKSDDDLHIDYADIDYDRLRQHPKIRQYIEASSNRTAGTRSRLQIILSSITDHFNELLETSKHGTKRPPAVAATHTDESEADSEVEREAEEARREKTRHAADRRLRNIFKQFIRRYLRGIQSRDFQQNAGHEVIGYNYIIFSHLLWRLSQKEFFQEELTFIVEAMVQTWSHFWGTSATPGYFPSLNQEQREECKQWLRKNHSEAHLLASLYLCEQLTHQDRALRLSLRDIWYHLLNTQPFNMNKDVLEETWIVVADVNRHEPPRPTRIVKALQQLAEFRSGYEFRQFIENRYGEGQYRFEAVIVHSPGAGKKIKTQCLVLASPDALATSEEAKTLLLSWMEYDELPNYRLVTPDLEQVQRLAFYDVQGSQGLFFNKETKEEEKFAHFVVPIPTWKNVMAHLLDLAAEVDETMTFQFSAQQANVVQTNHHSDA